MKFNTETLEQKSVIKYLGVYIDSKLSWTNQVDHVLKKLATHSFVIWQLRSKVSVDLLKLYYFSYIHSCLSYSVVAWGNCPRANEVFIQQKKIVRTMLHKPPRHSARELFCKLHISTFPSIFKYNSVMLEIGCLPLAMAL